MNQIKGILLGVVVGGGLFIGAFPVLFFNEKGTVENLAAIAKARDIVVAVEADEIKPENDGKLVHFTGTEETDEVLKDDVFGVSVNAVHLKRNVEMYQWVEEKEDGEDNKKPTYTYSKDWLDHHEDSSDFHDPSHFNPSMLFVNYEDSATNVHVGAFPLNEDLIGQIEGYKPLTPSLDDVPEGIRPTLAVTSDGFYLPMSAREAMVSPAAPETPSDTPENDDAPKSDTPGDDATSLRVLPWDETTPQVVLTSFKQEPESSASPAADSADNADASNEDAAAAPADTPDTATAETSNEPPPTEPAPQSSTSNVKVPSSAEVGDIRITFQQAPPGLKVSVISGQKGDKLEAFPVMPGYNQNDLRMGEKTADQIFDMQVNESNFMTWVWRIVGCLMMFFGLLLIMRPVTALADFVPFLGGIVGGIAFLIAGLVSFALSFITIAVSWVVVRPMIGIPLLIVSVALLAGAIYLIAKTRKQQVEPKPET